jgi:ABC-type transport system involved in multi-copper enzyme maturation permease subunit
VVRRRGVPTGRLLSSELRLLFGRRRNQALLVVLALLPVLIGIAIRVSNGPSEPGEGPPFLERVSGNGLFLSFTGLAAVVPFFLPLTVGVVSGDAVAGEAQTGTLRYLLTVPVSRTRLLLVKYGGLPVAAMATTVVLAISSQIFGAIPQLDWLHPFLFTDQWLAFADLLRDPVPTGAMVDGLVLQAAWITVALTIAWSRFTTRDITS